MQADTESDRVRSRLQRFFNAPESRVAQACHMLLVVLIIASVGVSMSGTMRGLSSGECDLLCNADLFFAALFGVEYLLRLYAAGNRFRYLFSFYGLIDLLAILPVFFTGMQGGSTLALRIARLLSILRLLKIIRYWGDMILLMEAMRDSLRLLAVVVLSVMILAVIGGNVIYFIEPDNFDSAYDGVWWALVTMSTVGYGDVVPYTALGKVVAGVGMFLGIGVFAVITAVIGSKIHVLTERQHRRCSSCSDIIPRLSRYCMHCGRLQPGKSKV